MSSRPLLNPSSPSSSVPSYLAPASEHEGSPRPVPILNKPGWYIAYYVPSLTWITKYPLKALPGDICAGLTLASFQIPVSLSYATSLAGVSAISGLWGLIISPFVYALLGSVPLMVVAPEGPISLVMGKAAAPYFNGDDQHMHGRSPLNPEQVSAMIAGSAGAIVLALGLARVGFLGNVLSQSMLRGFITGVGMVILADQLPAQFGMHAEMRKLLGPAASSWQKLQFVFHNWRHAHVITTLFSFTGLAAILAIKSFKTRLYEKHGYKRAILIPEILIVVVISTIVSYLGDYESRGLAVVGDVTPEGLETHWMLRPKYWSDFRINFQSSLSIGVLGILESTVAARMLGTGENASSANRELVALGTANVLGSVFGSLPSFGGYGRSKINSLTGGTTQISAIVASVSTLVFTYKFIGLLFYLPKCTLSSVISSIGIALIMEAPKEVKFFCRVRAHSDLATILISLLVTFFVSVEAGVASGAAVGLIRLLHSATRPRVQILARKPGSYQFINADDDDETSPEAHHLHSGILVVKVPEPLNFANSVVLEGRLRRLELHRTTKVHPGFPAHPDRCLEVVVFHLKGMTELDATAATVLKSIVESYLNRGVRVIFTHVVNRQEIQTMLDRSSIKDLLESQPKQAFFNTVDDAIANTQYLS